jgi:hypothetical protein
LLALTFPLSRPWVTAPSSKAELGAFDVRLRQSRQVSHQNLSRAQVLTLACTCLGAPDAKLAAIAIPSSSKQNKPERMSNDADGNKEEIMYQNVRKVRQNVRRVNESQCEEGVTLTQQNCKLCLSPVTKTSGANVNSISFSNRHLPQTLVSLSFKILSHDAVLVLSQEPTDLPLSQ